VGYYERGGVEKSHDNNPTLGSARVVVIERSLRGADR
jgi:hypothetical protein